MAQSTVRRRRAKIGVTVNPDLLGAVDRYVAEHPEADRSKIIDEALWLWVAKQQEQAMREQFEASEEAPPEEIAAWRAIRNAAWEQRLAKWDEHERREGGEQ